MNLYIVTGASRGLGKSLLELATDRGHQVAAISRSSTIKHDRILSVQQDLQEVERLSDLIPSIIDSVGISNFKAVHLINNAGVVEPVDLAERLLPVDVDRNIKVNLVAPMLLANSFLKKTDGFPGLRSIVNISSGAAERAKASWSLYSAAKGGLRLYTQALAQELGSSKTTRIISFNPGIMDTEMQEYIRRQPQDRFQDVEKFKNYKEQGQLVAPERVARALLDLIDFLGKSSSISKVDYSFQELL